MVIWCRRFTGECETKNSTHILEEEAGEMWLGLGSSCVKMQPFIAELKKAPAFAFSIRAAPQAHSDATDEMPSCIGGLNSLRVSEKPL